MADNFSPFRGDNVAAIVGAFLPVCGEDAPVHKSAGCPSGRVGFAGKVQAR